MKFNFKYLDLKFVESAAEFDQCLQHDMQEIAFIGASNAVNLTDGLDGLATVPVMLVALSFTLISYVVGNTIFSEYLQIQYIPDVGELSIFCGSVAPVPIT